MIRNIFNTGSIPALEQILHFTSEQHKAIVNNIANFDTPGYKAIDAPEAEFNELLIKAMEEQSSSVSRVFNFEGSNRIKPKAGGGLEVEFLNSLDSGIMTHAENNVNIDKEMGKLTKNAMMHNFAATLIAHQFNMLHEAISERVTG